MNDGIVYNVYEKVPVEKPKLLLVKPSDFGSDGKQSHAKGSNEEFMQSKVLPVVPGVLEWEIYEVPLGPPVEGSIEGKHVHGSMF